MANGAAVILILEEVPGQPRFHWARYLIANGKMPAVTTTAIAREIAAFLWAIGNQVEPKAPTAVNSK